MKDKLDFLEWMANVVKSVHYADVEAMDRAMEKIK